VIDSKKRQLLVEQIDSHLRRTARQLIKFDTLDETLNYLIEAFCEQFSCDYVAINLKLRGCLAARVAKGESFHLHHALPLPLERCSPRFFMDAVCSDHVISEEERCSFLENLEQEGFASWFTVPIKECDSDSFGVLVIGFRHYVPLVLDAEKLFQEFGKDIATAIGLSKERENKKKKMKGMEWLKENACLGSSIEELISGILEQVRKGTHVESAFVYLYDEVDHSFVYHPPSYGPINAPEKIKIEGNYHISSYFPFIEKIGREEITVPLIVNFKTIGVLHARNKKGKAFSQEDLETLQFLSSHVSVLIENARLYKNQIEDKSRLEKLVVHHQELVKQTLVGEGFSEITNTLAQMIGHTVVLFDRFFRPISHHLIDMKQNQLEQLFRQLDLEKWNFFQANYQEQWVKLADQDDFGIWRVVGGGDLLGYLGVKISKREADLLLRMTFNHALHVYAIQFIKQKLVLEAKEQVKDSFLNKLFVENIQNQEEIIEYASIFHLDIFQAHKIGIFSIDLNDDVGQASSLLETEAKKTWIWERIRENLLQYDRDIIVTRKDGFYILIAPDKPDRCWEQVYARLTRGAALEGEKVEICLGISKSTERLEDYYVCYKQALQTLKIVRHQFKRKGFLSFDNLGSYSILYDLRDTFAAQLFLKNYLDPLLSYGNGKGKGKDLFDTLRAYLYKNGNLKDTADDLFIHRSSLKYRLEKIEEILQIKLEDAEERFHLMLAYKLYDLYHLED
jgi:sugar diacid utilization regulator